MKFIYAEYTMYHNSVDVTTFDGYLLRIDCKLAIDEPLEYARLALDDNLQMWVDAEDSLELWSF